MIARENVTSRGVVGAGIVALHVGAAILLMTAGVIKVPPLAPSVEVAFLPQMEHQTERPPQLEQPVLHPQQVFIPQPEVEVEVEQNTTAISAVAVATPPPSTPAPTAPSQGNAVPVMSDVAYLVQPSPHYPPESRRIREQGLVVLRVLIDELGHAKSVEIYKSSGHPRLDEAARNAVAHAVFKPFTDGGIARAAAAIVPIEFSLHAS